jgi:hypothetical protein
MPRIVWNEERRHTGVVLPLEIHYGSPNELFEGLTSTESADSIFLPTDLPHAIGSTRDVVVHIGLINRSVRLTGRVDARVPVAEARRAGSTAGIHLSLLGADGSPSAELRKILVQLRQGLTYEAARVSDSTTGERLSRERQLRAMPTTMKLMLAIKAERQDRLALSSDPDPQVIVYLLKNTKIGLDEIRALAAKTSLNHQHLTIIAGTAAWMADDQVKINVARNPRLPDTLVEPLLASLSVAQLKIVAASVSTSPKAKRVAHRILDSRGA